MHFKMNFLFPPLLAAAMLVDPVCAHAASFDCAKARSPMEKLICADSRLSSLDEQLNAAYREAIARTDAKSLLATWQRGWLKSYDVTQCKDAQCLSIEFGKRLSLLQSVAPGSHPAAKWNGKFIRYVNGKVDKDTANLLLIGMSGNRIYVEGDALWHGPNAANGQVNTGEMLGLGELKAGKGVFDLDGCTATMAIKDGGIHVEEASGCGGMNVSFVGEYKRK